MTKTRPATAMVALVNQYCAPYPSLFKNVRHFQQFTALHLGLLAETRHKALPRLGKKVHMDPQALHHFLASADWSVERVRAQRLLLLLNFDYVPVPPKAAPHANDTQRQIAAQYTLSEADVFWAATAADTRRILTVAADWDS